MKNDPALQCDTVPGKREIKRPVGCRSVLSRKTEVSQVEKKAVNPTRCPIHRADHSLNKCRASDSCQCRSDVVVKYVCPTVSGAMM